MGEFNSSSTQNQHGNCELLPCPFCGGEAEYIQEGCVIGRVRCKECGISQTLLGTKEEVVGDWNTRTKERSANE